MSQYTRLGIRIWVTVGFGVRGAGGGGGGWENKKSYHVPGKPAITQWSSGRERAHKLLVTSCQPIISYYSGLHFSEPLLPWECTLFSNVTWYTHVLLYRCQGNMQNGPVMLFQHKLHEVPPALFIEIRALLSEVLGKSSRRARHPFPLGVDKL